MARLSERVMEAFKGAAPERPGARIPILMEAIMKSYGGKGRHSPEIACLASAPGQQPGSTHCWQSWLRCLPAGDIALPGPFAAWQCRRVCLDACVYGRDASSSFGPRAAAARSSADIADEAIDRICLEGRFAPRMIVSFHSRSDPRISFHRLPLAHLRNFSRFSPSRWRL